MRDAARVERLAWLDRWMLPRRTPLAPSRWHTHVVQRRVSRLDHLRPHRLNWDALKHPEPPPTTEPEEILTPRRLAGIRWFWLDGIFTTVSDNLYLGFIILYALAYGASTSELGLLAAIQNLLGAVSLFPGARLADRARRRKWLVTWSVGGVARVSLLALALVPWVASTPRAAIWLIIGLNGLRSFMSNFGNPAWTVLIGELVPRFLRAAYFANRNLTMGLAALLVAPLAGWLIKAGNGLGGLPQLGYQAVFLLAFGTGLLGTLCFLRIPEPHGMPRTACPTGAGPLWGAIAGNRTFMGLVVSGFVWNLALQVAAPFFNVYLVRDLGAGAGTVGILAGVNTLFGLIGSAVFGRFMDRAGAVRTQALTGLMIPIIPTAWIWVSAPWQVGVLEAYAGLVWAGYNLANFTLLLELTPSAHRSQAVALYQTVVFGSAVLGPLLGGWLADALGFRFIFGASGAGRFLGIALFVWLAVWPGARVTAGTAGAPRR